MTKKKYLNKLDNLGTFDMYDLDGDLSDVIDTLKELHAELGKGYSKIVFDVDLGPSNGCIYIVGFRQETDDERDKRLGEAKKAREAKKEVRKAKEAKEIKELKRLLAKYSDKAKELTAIGVK